MNRKYFERNADALAKFFEGHNYERIATLCQLRQSRAHHIVMEVAKWLMMRATQEKIVLPFTQDRYPHLYYKYPDRGVQFNSYMLKNEDIMREKDFFQKRMAVELEKFRQEEEARKLLPPPETKISKLGSQNLERDIAVAKHALDAPTYVVAGTKFGLTAGRTRDILMERWRISIARIERNKEPHPFTQEKYPQLYADHRGVSSFKTWAFPRDVLMAEKEFVCKELEKQLL